MQMIDSLDNQCMNCLRCVQNCPKELIHKSVNPEFKALGDAHWTPDIIARLWYQAETGKIPVSGAGYTGPFSGPGFDSMWTDMSEIVRPTRDGIHGREYISTAVDLGTTPRCLQFREGGRITGDRPQVVDIPLPILLKVPAFGSVSEETLKGWAWAAKGLGTLVALPQDLVGPQMDAFKDALLPVVLNEESDGEKGLDGVPMVEIPWGEAWQNRADQLRARHPSLLLSLRVPLGEGMETRALAAVEAGIPVIHVEGSMGGRYVDDPSNYIKDGIRSVHLHMVEAGIRDEVTLLASGGIAMAEQVAKSVICGADAVFVDFPILIALECRMCRRCTKGLSCPVEIEKAPSGWVTDRVMNLAGAWHNQLLEVMGAMGIRDARRLRGEAGRAMFFEELDQETFASTGEVEEGCEFE
jgi:ferredoxin